MSSRYSEDSIAMWKAASRAGWKTERLHGWQIPEWLRTEDVVPYGGFAITSTETLDLGLLEPPLDWLATLPIDYVLRPIQFTTLGEARLHNVRAFIKPADDKCFVAKVYNSGMELPSPELLPDSTAVLISEPVVWEAEFRCFALDGRVLTISPYLRRGVLAKAEDGGWPASDDEENTAIELAERVLADSRVSLPPAVVIDVGLISGRGWAVVEANPAFASGIYGCDPDSVLRVLRRASQKNTVITNEDKKWLISRT